MVKSVDKTPATSPTTEIKQECGLVMPISALDGCSAEHWADVKEILADALKVVGFEATLVSDADNAEVIHKRIIENLYKHPVIVCDVSGKNPNVMFELGMRLAFDKPTIIVKDDKTSYSFDTSPIEHLSYPRDLRYAEIVKFKAKLGEKAKKAFEFVQKPDSEYTTFFKAFGPFSIPKVETTEVPRQEYLLEQLREDFDEFRRLVLRGDLRDPLESEPGDVSFVVEAITHRGSRKPVRVKSGMLLQGSGPPVFLIEKGVRRWIPNERTLGKMGFSWGTITRVADDVLEMIPRGDDLPSL